MAFLTLTEAADYARFACAAYAVFEHEDKDVTDKDGDHTKGHDTQSCGCCQSKSNLRSYASVVRSGFKALRKLLHDIKALYDARVALGALVKAAVLPTAVPARACMAGRQMSAVQSLAHHQLLVANLCLRPCSPLSRRVSGRAVLANQFEVFDSQRKYW